MESLEKRAGTFKFLFVPFLLVARRIKAIYVTMKVPNCFPSLLSFKKKVRLLSQIKKMEPSSLPIHFSL